MHDDATNTKKPDITGLGTICKANECRARDDWGPLFDDLWNEGEIALMFGPPGVGKSVLAIQIADALARGRPIDGFGMPEQRCRVLYVDLKLTESQFAERYTFEPDYDTTRRFYHSGNLYFGHPHDPAKLCDYLRAAVAEKHISTVIIDDTSELRSTFDGTRETLVVMRQLRQLQRELGLSVLVIASSREPGRTGLVRESDLMRSRVLCEAADSVFALGVHPQDPSWRYLVQTRSRSGEPYFMGGNMPFCRMLKTEDGNLAFVFDDKFVHRYEAEDLLDIVEIKRLRDEGKTFRQIAEELCMPVSRAHRLSQKWSPDLERAEKTPARHEPDGLHKVEAAPSADEAETASADEIVEVADEVPVPPDVTGAPPDSTTLDRMELTGNWPTWIGRGLTRDITDVGREILVRCYDERGRPKIYYTVTKKGLVTRWTRDDWGAIGRKVDPPRPIGSGLHLANRLRSQARSAAGSGNSSMGNCSPAD